MALGSRAFAAIGAAAIAASALIALLLLAGGAGDGGAAGPTGAGARPASVAPAAAAPTTRAEAAALAEHDPPPPDPPPADDGAAVEVRVLLGGVQPMPGCLVMSADRREDGGFVVGTGDDCADPGVTDDEGTFVLRWVSEPKERLITMSVGGHGNVERVEGAAEVGVRGAGQLVLLAGAAPVTVHIEDGSVPRVRILDAATGLALPPDVGAVVEYAHPDAPGWQSGKLVRRPLRHEAGGWWALPEIEGEAVAPRVRAAGFRDAPLEDWRGPGRLVVRLTASDTGVKGLLEPPESAPLLASVSIRRVGGRAALRQPTLARVRSRQFFVDGLEEGEWEIEAEWRRSGNSPGTDQWTVRRFEYRGGLLDLGTLHAAPGATLSIRWASPVAFPAGASLELRIDRNDAVVDEDDSLKLRDDPAVSPDESGLFQFRGLRPGGEYRLRCGRFPGYEEKVRAPAEPGATAGYEAGRDLRLVKCRLTFTVDGKKPAGPVSLDGPFQDVEFDMERVLVETRLVPGRHRFEARVSYPNTDILPRHASHEVEVQVPDQAEFEATVDLLSTDFLRD